MEQQAAQPQGTNYWTTHKGKGQVVPTERIYPEGFRGQMYPAGAAVNHPAAPELRKWATEGCPVDTGPKWTPEQIQAALERGPHLSVMKPDAMRAFREEVASKMEKDQVKIITWDDVKDDPPKELKLSPMAQIPHKSRAYRTLLDLSHEVMKAGQLIAPSVNSTTVPLAPEAALMQMRSVLTQIIICDGAMPRGFCYILLKV